MKKHKTDDREIGLFATLPEETIALIISLGSFHPWCNLNWYFYDMCYKILSTQQKNLAIIHAAQNGLINFVDWLLEVKLQIYLQYNLQHNYSDQTFDRYGCWRLYWRCNGTNFHKLDPDTDPSAYDSAALQFAAKNGHIDIVKLLLEDDRVDPSTDDNFAIRRSAESGHVDVVDRLLEDDRVDPSVYDNFALRRALENGHLPVVERLLQDHRVTSASHRVARDIAWRRGYQHIVLRLDQLGSVISNTIS